jgi:hypothetical protein
VQSNGQKTMNLPPTEPGSSRPAPPPVATGRYAYPGGSRPLEGYTIKRGIGRGGFGEVYYAVSDAGKEVALKLIRRNLDVELRGIKQCLNLKHPNLLAVHDIRQDERGDHWVIMEHVAGDCLDDVLSAQPDGLPVDEALRWFHGIAAGVAYLHDHGIVHRDLKPGNIFSDEGRVEIGDYGLSKFISCSRRSGQTESVGTVHYMAPEIANGRYGKEIDIYALGVIFHEMLTGRVPFEGESVGEVLMKHLTAEPDLSMLAEPYRGGVARALEKDPAKRFASVAEMLAPLPRPAGSSQIAGLAIPVAAVVPVVVDAPADTPADAYTDASDEEPILRELRQFLIRARDGWNNMGTLAQVVMLVLSLIALMVFGQVLIPVTLLLLMAYGGYRLVRAIVLSGRPPRRRHAPAPPGVSPARAAPARAAPVRNHAARAAAPRQERFHSRRARVQEEAAAALVLGSPRERTAGLLGAMLLGDVPGDGDCGRVPRRVASARADRLAGPGEHRRDLVRAPSFGRGPGAKRCSGGSF